MMHPQKLVPAILLLASLSSQAEDSATLTLQTCIQESLRNHPQSVMSRQAEEAAKDDVATASGRYYPEVGFQTGYRYWKTHIFLPDQLSGPRIPPVVGPVNDWQLSVRANYVVYDSGLRSSDVGIAKAQLSAAQEEAGRTRADLIYRVESSYYDVLRSEDGVGLAKQALERSKDHLRIAEERKAAGAVPQADVTRARTEVASAELGIASADSALRLAQGRLNESMGRGAADPLRIGRTDMTPPDPATVNIQGALQRAAAERPEVLAAQKRAEAKQKQIGIARSEILPKLRAEAGFGWRDSDFDPPDKDWYVGLMLNIPLYDGGVRSSRIAKSKIEANREAEQVAQVKLSVQQEVWAAYSAWIEAFQALQSSSVMRDQAAESVDLIKARYEEGAGTINDLLDAELALNQADLQLNNARYRLQIAYAAYRRAAATSEQPPSSQSTPGGE